MSKACAFPLLHSSGERGTICFKMCRISKEGDNRLAIQVLSKEMMFEQSLDIKKGMSHRT